MPIYMRLEGVDGTVRSGASGGVWKTTNFLTSDPAAGVVRLSRISMVNGVGGVDGRDPTPTRKALQMFEAARSRGPMGVLYVATDAGVFLGSVNNRGKLIVGVDNVRLSRPRVGRLISSDGGRTWNARVVEIFVSDTGGANGLTFRLWDVRASTQGRGLMTLTTS